MNEYHDEIEEAELNFLYWLDTEIKKIDDFYREREKAASDRYKHIAAQLEALCQLRDSHQPNQSNKFLQGIPATESSFHDNGSSLLSAWQRLISKFWTSLDRLSSAMPAADHERRVKDPELMANPITTTAGYFEYRVARRRLKQAIFEFYRGMELLKGFQSLNRRAVAKILKKFDKNSRRKISGEYEEKLKSMHFEQGNELENLMDQTEVWGRFRIS
jgi:SPX domain protein involved in polyphosphate accumulation